MIQKIILNGFKLIVHGKLLQLASNSVQLCVWKILKITFVICMFTLMALVMEC